MLAVVLRRQGGGPGRQKYDELNTSVSDTTGLLPMSDSPAAPLPDFLKSGGESNRVCFTYLRYSAPTRSTK